MNYAFLYPRQISTLLILFAVFTASAFAQDDPIEISTWGDLYDIRNDLSADYILINDLTPEASDYSTFVKDGDDLVDGGQGWLPIGNSSSPFTGELDGNNFTIRGLEINRGSDEEIGLFGAIDGATIKDLAIEDAVITANGGEESVGIISILAGDGGSDVVIENVDIFGTITISSDETVSSVGFFAGEALDNWEVKNATANGEISIEADGYIRRIGLFAGDPRNEWIFENSSATGEISAESFSDYVAITGLLAGRPGADWKLTDTFAEGNITIKAGRFVEEVAHIAGTNGGGWELNKVHTEGKIDITADTLLEEPYEEEDGTFVRRVGGLNAGNASNWVIEDSYTDVEITIESVGEISIVGGVAAIGSSNWELNNVRSEGDINLTSKNSRVLRASLFVGEAQTGWTIENSEAIGNITVQAAGEVLDIGLIAGRAFGEWNITNSGATGDISIVSEEGRVTTIGLLAGDPSASWTLNGAYANGDINIESPLQVQEIGLIAGDPGGSWTVDDSHAAGNIVISSGRFVREVALFAGDPGNSWTVNNSYVEGDVTINANTAISELSEDPDAATRFIALFAGNPGSGWDVTDSYAKGNLSINAIADVNQIGLFAGSITNNLDFIDSRAEGDIEINSTEGEVKSVGLVFGWGASGNLVQDSHAYGDITINAGGNSSEIALIAGRVSSNFSGQNSIAKGNIELQVNDLSDVGMILGTGVQPVTVEKTYSRGNISVEGGENLSGIGLLIGRAAFNDGFTLGSSNLSESFSSGSISISTSAASPNHTGIGGLIGIIEDYEGESFSLENTYAEAEIDAKDAKDVGGLIGAINGSTQIFDSYAVGNVTADDDFGGLVGVQTGTNSIEDSFFDSELNPDMPDAPSFGRTTTEMKGTDLFTGAGWDFTDVWTTAAAQDPGFISYPYLREIDYDEFDALEAVNPVPGLEEVLVIAPDSDGILYVNQNVVGGNETGSSWENALPELRTALDWAQDWDYDADGALQIWVAAGVYLPTDDDEDREATFQLVNGVELYGGFAGGEDSVEASNWEANLTILSGDIDGNDQVNDDGITETWEDIEGSNSYHVVISSGTDNTAVLDGFIITGGQANGGIPANNGGGLLNLTGSPSITNVIFSGNLASNNGGGMFIEMGSPTLINVNFYKNKSNLGGGIFSASNSDGAANPILTNVVFNGNVANSSGGAMYNIAGTGQTVSPTLTNVTFSGNVSGLDGGGMFNRAAPDGTVNPILTNVIIWGNQAGGQVNTASASIFNEGSGANPKISHSLIGNSGGSDSWDDDLGEDLGNNIDADPMFADPDAGDFRLTEFSPAINAGSNAPFEAGGVAEGITTDLDGNTRIFGGTVDMGAYEFQGEPGVVPGGEDRRVLVSNAADEYTFTQPDFSVDETVSAVKIETIAGGGTLQLDGEAVDEGDVITSAQLSGGQLRWIPDAGEHGYGYASFVFRLINEFDVESTEEATLFIDLAATSVALSGGKGWRFLTSPSHGDTFEDFLAPVYVQGVPGSDNPGAQDASLYILNQEEYRWELPEEMSDEITPDRGFIVFGFEDDMPATLTSGTNWLPLDETFEYEGLFYDPGQGEHGDSHFLLGNPHPISLDFCEFIAEDVADNIQIWDPALNDGDYVTLSCANGGAEIAPFQAFWIRTLSGEGEGPPGEQGPQGPQGKEGPPGDEGEEGPDIISTSELLIPEEAYLPGPAGGYFKQSPREDLFAISLHLAEDREGFTNDVQILFSEKATEGMDGHDAPKLSAQGLAPRWLSFYALDEDNRAYAIRSLPTAQTREQLTIPLHVETTQAGSYTLSWELPSSEHYAGSYYLRDTHTGTLTELTAGQTYRFEVEATATAKAPNSPLLGGTQGGYGMAQKASHGITPRFELILSERGLHEENNLPTRITLNQNYPNPFNPSTIISYELPEQAHVRLSVYDMTGRRVATLVNEQVNAGRHQVSFNAMNLASGVYIYRLQAGGTVLSRQLTLIK